MTEIKSLATVENGVLKHVFPAKFGADVKALRDGEYSIHIKRNGKRSSNQNRYYFGVVVAMLNSEFIRLGNDVNPDITHQFLKSKFHSVNLHDADGTVIDKISGHTSAMNKIEFMGYLDKIIAWAAETFSLVIPPPNSFADLETFYNNQP